MLKRINALLPAVLVAALSLAGALPAAAQVAPPAAAAPQPAGGVQVDELIVRGNVRTDASAIRVLSMLESGRLVTAADIQTAIRRLMQTGNFETVEVLSEGEPPNTVRLILQVTERPIIAAYEIQGLTRVNARTVRDTVGLQSNLAYNPTTVLRTERVIRDMLAREGIQVISIDTSRVPVPGQPGTYNFVFQVTEGNRLAIADIQFEGNQAFTTEQLRGAMSTKPEGFFWFRTGRFDRETFQTDLAQNLPQFYGARGYIDFQVVSDDIVIDPVTGKARLIVRVDEGAQYRLGDFAIEGAHRFPIDMLERMYTAQRRSVLGLPFGRRDDQEQGEVFDRSALDGATQRVSQLYRNEGYLYAQVEPIVQRVQGPNGEPMVDVTWAVSERSPFYINRVVIQGNTFTHESVIRDRLVVYPGDVYSEDRLLQSYRSIAALGFFETPLPSPDIIPDPEAGTVDLYFRVEEKQTGSVNFGTSIGGGGYGRAGGVSGFLGYSQPNLFGQAKEASMQAEYGYGRSSFTASYTDPALFGTRNSGSISLFHTDDRYRNLSFSDGRYMRTGAALRYGFPLANFRWTRAFAGYSLSRYSYEARDVDDCEPGNIFCQPSAVASNLSLAVTRDTKDHPLFPTAGTRQNLTLGHTGGPLGGDGNFQKLIGETEWWTPVLRLGGGEPGTRPIVGTFGLNSRAGTVFGDATRFPLERFFLGGTQFGQMLRGYDESTVTPFGYFDRRDARLSSGERLGDAFAVVTGEFALRISDALSVSLFAEGGNIWHSPGTINPSRLYRSLGIGGNVVTPFGPLGVDLAYGFDRDVPGWKFHFKINQPGF
jgi:outer membrane protein insertion porin family